MSTRWFDTKPTLRISKWFYSKVIHYIGNMVVKKRQMRRLKNDRANSWQLTLNCRSIIIIWLWQSESQTADRRPLFLIVDLDVMSISCFLLLLLICWFYEFISTELWQRDNTMFFGIGLQRLLQVMFSTSTQNAWSCTFVRFWNCSRSFARSPFFVSVSYDDNQYNDILKSFSW